MTARERRAKRRKCLQPKRREPGVWLRTHNPQSISRVLKAFVSKEMRNGRQPE
jgi:hypothetical protein